MIKILVPSMACKVIDHAIQIFGTPFQFYYFTFFLSLTHSPNCVSLFIHSVFPLRHPVKLPHRVGAAGVSDEFPLAPFYAQARTLRIADGPDEVHLMQLAKFEYSKYRNAKL